MLQALLGGERETAMFPVRLTQANDGPFRSRRNSAGRGNSAPSVPALGADTSYRRMIFGFGSDSSGMKGLLARFALGAVISGDGLVMPHDTKAARNEFESRRWMETPQLGVASSHQKPRSKKNPTRHI